MEKYLLSIDQGTSSTRAIIFNKLGEIQAISSQAISCHSLKAGYVEQDPLEIIESVKYVIKHIFNNTTIRPHQIDSIGITNQRETTILWNKKTGLPVYNAIVWQSKQSNEICEELINNNYQTMIQEKTGLPIDSYFSATKIKWIIDNVDGIKESIAQDEILFGTIDTWILWNLSLNHVHCTDYSNASRTMLFNIKTLTWDEDILKLLAIPSSILPHINNSSHYYDKLNPEYFFNISPPITALIGDQQAALFGQTCFEQGDLKNTYGTGCFLLLNTKDKLISSKHGLITTIAWSIDNKIDYALEGSIFVAGSALQWLKDNLKIINDVNEVEIKANYVNDNDGVIVVPTFSGLGSPYWDMEVKGAIFGLSHSTTTNHIIRATLESLAYQTKDIIDIMVKESNIKLNKLKVDGKASENNLLMQFQSDILNLVLEQPLTYETTALGAAYLAGLATNYYQSIDEIKHNHQVKKTYHPQMKQDQVIKLYQQWQKALQSCLLYK